MKHVAHYFRNGYLPEITTMPEFNLGIVVVIPCFNEPDVARAIQALARCCKPACAVEILVVINFDEQVDDSVKAVCYTNYTEVQMLATTLWAKGFSIHPILKENLPHKTAGVGMARKIGMDEAVYRFSTLTKPHGIIACFDADATCDDNYFTSIEAHYLQNTTIQASSVYYEHPLSGGAFTDDIYWGIAQYELHLRYYNQASRWAGLPFAYHTVGSSMVCTASGYAKVGGMNKRKAGEDFYFLQKLIQLGHFSEINATRVIPSPRVSDRVPFGTGRAMMKYVDEKQPEMYTYSVESFVAIRQFTANLPHLFRANQPTQKSVVNSLHPILAVYLEELNYYDAINELNANCADSFAFEKRFFTWFDAFRLLKFMNWAHEQDKGWAKQSVVNEAAKLLLLLQNNTTTADAKNLLLTYRTIERNYKSF